MIIEDEFYMKRCLVLAKRGVGRVSPNPMVGAVLVKEGKILAEDYHRGPGTPHAEALVIKKASSHVKDSTLYVNLEPCVHFGRTPPCLPTIINAKIRRVVVGMIDPNPAVKGRGIEGLKGAGVEVSVGVLEEKAKTLNEVYIKYITTHLPFVILKLAISLDGRIKGEDRGWISGELSRKFSHRIRREVDAILVGVGTVIADDPLLTTRLVKGKDPLRIILDTTARTPLNAKVVKKDTILATTKKATEEKLKELKKRGVNILVVKEKDGRVDLLDLLKRIGRLGVSSLLVEGGGKVASSFLKEGLVDKVMFFISGKIIGRRGLLGIDSCFPLIQLEGLTYKKVGEDILVVGYVHRTCGRKRNN
jgi:diaminohydroxyphosphoribosylaminopyrimidine deaminase/5-amino-6-(5-phosphoribosylamino)uracil reductase